MKQDETDSPGVMFLPPLAHFGMLVAGLALHFAFPQRFLPGIWLQLAIGLPLIAISVIPAIWAARTMRRAETEISSSKPTTAIVVRGPFRFSRNPMYLALTVLYIGIATSVNALWAIVLLPVALVALSLGVINREERYLERKFGQEYLRYKARVRRWL